MSGYFERLVQRAQGGAALAGLPVIRPLPAIYRGVKMERDTAVVSLDVEAETLASERAAALERNPVANKLEAMRRTILPNRERRIEREVDARQHADPPTLVVRHAPSPPLEQRADAVTQRHGAKKGAPLPTAAQYRPKQGKPPDPPPTRVSNFTSITKIADAIEATPPAQRAAAVMLWPEHPSERGDAPPLPPSISIGRIDIVVAPPPLPAAPVERTRGFESYARLRRGLAR